MRTIHKVVCTVDYTGPDMQKLCAVFSGIPFVKVDPNDTERLIAELRDADVAVLNGDLDDRILTGQKLKWIHCNHAGLAKSARPEVFERGIILTGSAGRSAPVLAEHCIYFMLNACYHTHETLAAQYAHHWGVPGMQNWYGLFGRKAGIIGMGNTGKMLAERLHALGMEIVAYDRTRPEGFDYIEKWVDAGVEGSINGLYAECEFIILCIALTDQTWHMVNDEAFSHFRKGAVLVNMARGALIDTDALIRALDSKIVSAAGLDVFEQEPLPKEHPLWDRKDVYMTAHCTPMVPSRAERCIEIIQENLRRYLAEEDMLNRVLPYDMYTH